ncbi:unnamed protein product [Mucor hiemalis]
MVPRRESHFLKLPSEILQQIIHLSAIKEENDVHYEIHGWPYPEHSYIHLKSIALCCRRLYILVAPFLWRDKEFILPREDDEKSKHPVVQMATDILSKKALFQQDYNLGDYVRSLSRDLTHGPHYNLTNSKLMAQLVLNLQALRIDFHPKARSEEYGLRYFVEYCPNLSELYLSNCRDTFDDFLSLHEFKPPLKALTLTDCTMKEATLNALSTHSLPLLSKLLLQHVLIEPSLPTRSNTHLIDTTLSFIHPFHYQNTNATLIPFAIYQSFIKHHQLTQLALGDSVPYSVVQELITSSPYLEKLAIVLHDTDPVYVNKGLHAISQLSSLSILSLAFRRTDPISKESEKLPCHVPAQCWHKFASQLPSLKSLYISSSRVLLYPNFITTLFNTSPHLSNVIIHNIALVTSTPSDTHELFDAYTNDSLNISYSIQDWNTKDGFYTCQQAKDKGFECFDETDQVCYIKGF